MPISKLASFMEVVRLGKKFERSCLLPPPHPSLTEQDEPTLREQLLRFKVCSLETSLLLPHTHPSSSPLSLATQHKTRTLVSTTKGVKHLSGELQSSSDLDFYIDGVSVILKTGEKAKFWKILLSDLC